MCAAGILSTANRYTCKRIYIDKNFSALSTDIIAQHLLLRFCRFHGEVYAARFRDNTDIPLRHELH